MARNFKRPDLGYVWYLSESVALFGLAFVICYLYFRPARWVQGGSLLGDVLVPLGATFAGAMLAFHLQNVREKSAQLARNKTEAGLAFFKLSRLVNRLRNWQTEVVERHEADPAPMISMPALTNQSLPAEIDFDRLAFLFPKDADLLGEMAIAQDRFISLVDLVNERSRFLREVVQSKLKAAGLNESFDGSMSDLVAIIGEGDFRELCNLSRQMVECVNSDFPRLLDLTNRFGSSLGAYFPGMRLRLDIPGLTPK